MRDTGPVVRVPVTNSRPSSPTDEAPSAIVDDQDIVCEDVFEESEEARESTHTAPKRGEKSRNTTERTLLCAAGANFAGAPHFPRRARNSDQRAIKNEIAADYCFLRDVSGGPSQPVLVGSVEEQGCSLTTPSLTKELGLNGWRNRWPVTSVSAAIMEE